MKKTPKVRIGSVASALDRFEETWKKAARGEKVPAEQVLTFTNLQLLLRTLTPARWTCLSGCAPTARSP
jgi:predicted transcriptional regulator